MRLLKLHKEVMYPKKCVNVKDLMERIITWENKWVNMMKQEFKEGKGIEIPAMWKMAAFIEMCPDGIQENVFMMIDEIGEDYDKLRAKVVGWASNKVESAGAVPMDIGNVGQYGEEEYDVDAVGPNTQCYRCYGYGHMSRQCPKGGGKGNEKGKGFYGGSGGGQKGGGKGFSGGWKGGGKAKGAEKGYKGGSAKGKGKGKGYQGECWRCHQIGHKAYECYGLDEEGEQQPEEGEEVEEIGGCFMVAGIESDGSDGGDVRCVDCEEEFQRGSESAKTGGSYIEAEEKWRKSEIDVIEAELEWRMLQRRGGAVKKKEEEADETYDIDDLDGEEKGSENEITIDSGAGKSVWPESKKVSGRMRTLKKKINLIAANGTDIPIHGEKTVKFKSGDKRCAMNFLVTGVKKPLAAVSSIVEKGIVVVFGPGEDGSFIQNIETGEKIMMIRKKGTYVIKAEFEKAPKTAMVAPVEMVREGSDQAATFRRRA